MCVYIYVYYICDLKIFKTQSCTVSSFDLLKKNTLLYNPISKASLHCHISQSNQNHFLSKKSDFIFNANNMLMCPHDNHLSYKFYTRKKEGGKQLRREKKQGVKGREGRWLKRHKALPRVCVLTLQYFWWSLCILKLFFWCCFETFTS